MIVRNLEIKDAPHMLEWLTDSSINCFFKFDSSNMTMDDAVAFIEKAKDDLATKHYAIADELDEYLGTISLKNINQTDKNAEISISFRKRAHGTSYTSEGMKAVIKKAFSEYGLKKIYLNVLSNNIRAIKFYEKIGFVYEGTSLQHVRMNNQFYDLKWYAIFNEENL